MEPLPVRVPESPTNLSPASHSQLRDVCNRFAVRGKCVAGRAHGNGHINDTYAVTCETSAGPVRYILQRINNRVFRDVPALMENIQRVTAHAATRLARQGAEGRQTLHLIPTLRGEPFLQDDEGQFWRCYDFVENASTHDLVTNPRQAEEAAFAFGHFQGLLADLPGPRLHETIPGFHDTRRRFEALRRSAHADLHGRASGVRAEIDFAFEREPMVDTLLALQAAGKITERITHNDTKLNNVMLDDETGRGICVIDLDTVMPGLALYDFGDMIRSATNSAAEDERDLARVQVRLPVFQAVLKGYLRSARQFLNRVEIEHLVLSARLITFEIGTRFLTDYLDGDVYFKLRRPGQNLDRCRCQFALLRSMEKNEAKMQEYVEQCTR
jgi:hypothetical protein